MKIEQLEEKMKEHQKEGNIFKDPDLHSLTPFFQGKARHNLETSKILWKVSEEDEVKKALNVSGDYVGYDWVIGTAYYAMYHSALSALAQINIKTTTHEATIHAIEYHFTHKRKLLETEYIDFITKAHQLEVYYVNRLWAAKRMRTTAQYEADKTMSKEESEKLLKNAEWLIDRIDKLIEEIEGERKISD